MERWVTYDDTEQAKRASCNVCNESQPYVITLHDPSGAFPHIWKYWQCSASSRAVKNLYIRFLRDGGGVHQRSQQPGS